MENPKKKQAEKEAEAARDEPPTEEINENKTSTDDVGDREEPVESERNPHMVYFAPKMDRGYNPNEVTEVDRDKTVYNAYSWMGTTEQNRSKYSPAMASKNREAFDAQQHYNGTLGNQVTQPYQYT